MNKVRAGTAGAIEAVVNAINTHSDDPNVYKQGCDALWSITADNGKNIEKTEQK